MAILEKDIKVIASTLGKLLSFLPNFTGSAFPNFNKDNIILGKVKLKVIKGLVRLSFTCNAKNPNTGKIEKIETHYKLPVEVYTEKEELPDLDIDLSISDLHSSNITEIILRSLEDNKYIDDAKCFTLARYVDRFTVNFLSAINIKTVISLDKFKSALNYLLSPIPYSKDVLVDELEHLPITLFNDNSSYTFHPYVCLEYKADKADYSKYIPSSLTGCIPYKVLSTVLRFSKDASSKDTMCSVKTSESENKLTFTRLTGWITVPCDLSIKVDPPILEFINTRYTNKYAWYITEQAVSGIVELYAYLTELLDLDSVVEIYIDPTSKIVSIKPVFTASDLDDTEKLSIKILNTYLPPSNEFSASVDRFTFRVNLHTFTALLKINQFSEGFWLRGSDALYEEDLAENKDSDFPYLALVSSSNPGYNAYFSETYV